MSEAPRKEIPRPKGDDDLEDLALALFRAVSQDPGAKLHGRSGQGQDGVDIYGEDRFGGSGLNGVQCKQHGSATLLGNFLRRAHGGDIRRRREINLHRADEKQGGRASRVIAAYARWLGEGPELAILRLLGLFDRPAEAGALKALRAAPPIPGLTEPLVGLSDEDWRLAIATLRDHSLLAATDPREPEILDAHPLVRACFAEVLEGHRPAAWQEGNRRLYEHLRQEAPDFPDTLEAMQPLYAAVIHGCRAGRQQEAMEEVYWRRILRRNEFYSTHKLGPLAPS